MKTEFKTIEGRVLGWTEDAGDRLVGRTVRGSVVGFYSPKFDITRDVKGGVLGHGNQLAWLIREAME